MRPHSPRSRSILHDSRSSAPALRTLVGIHLHHRLTVRESGA
ncbi:hypothetical protein [Pseudomonas sp. BN102]|nr:hypothetical protein [Pseudomonas sp. BN102]